MIRSDLPQNARRIDPTPAEIRRLCAEIRAGWSPGEGERRRHGRIAWQVPTYATINASGIDTYGEAPLPPRLSKTRAKRVAPEVSPVGDGSPPGDPQQ